MQENVPVTCLSINLEFIGEYDSMAQAAKTLKIGRDRTSGAHIISNICSGNQKSTYSKELNRKVTFKYKR